VPVPGGSISRERAADQHEGNRAVDRFDICLKHTLAWEGQWSNHPKDKGGATMRGVIQRVYDGYRERKGLPKRTVRNITESELREIYRVNYWDQIRGDELPPGLDLAVFDFAVNSGPARSAKYLQKALKLNADGSIGPATLAACAGCDHAETIRAIMKERKKFLKGLSDYRYFGKGWSRRVAGIEPAALAMVGATSPKAPAVPLADPDKQSESQARAINEVKPAPPSIVAGTSTIATAGLGLASLPAPPDLSALTNWSSWSSGVASLWQWAGDSPRLVLLVFVALFGLWLAPWLTARVKLAWWRRAS
jgi:lysozyme family protein